MVAGTRLPSEAAALLALPETTLRSKMAKHGIEVPGSYDQNYPGRVGSEADVHPGFLAIITDDALGRRLAAEAGPIATEVMRSPCLMRSTSSMPDTTVPNTV